MHTRCQTCRTYLAVGTVIVRARFVTTHRKRYSATCSEVSAQESMLNVHQHVASRKEREFGVSSKSSSTHIREREASLAVLAYERI
jgi:hypothetical protein